MENARIICNNDQRMNLNAVADCGLLSCRVVLPFLRIADFVVRIETPIDIGFC